mmetsp:Transcript_107152/g.333011  ORF Transcript_107152/g.333011 Transcript_107152/m.333011 type:complete len:204 (-) Transcript_107152:357-968(-)
MQQGLQRLVGCGVGGGEDTAPRDLRCNRASVHELPRRSALRQPTHLRLRGGAKHRHYLSDLVAVVLAGEEGLPAEQLPEDAANGPDVDRLRVTPGQEYHLGRPVPPRDNVVRAVLRLALLVFRENARQAKVAYLGHAVPVHQDVGWLQVPVHNPSPVEVGEAHEDLVNKVLHMLLRQLLAGLDHAMKVRVHEVRDNVDVLEVG